MQCVSAAYADDFVDRADANGDGFVSLYELRAAHYADTEFNRRIEQSFADYDSDGDGLISAAERRAKRAEQASSEAAVSPVDATPDAHAGKGEIAREEPPAVRNDLSLSRTESWILQIDADNSGGASIAELVASGDGQQWFTDKAFAAADSNGDRDLDPDELEVLIRSLERRRR
jgi:Ca2+-binding EF-hand superfamily protein